MRVLKRSVREWVIRESESAARKPRHTLPPVIGPRRCASALSAHSHSPHPSQKCTLGDWEDGASAKPTICRRLEINDRPKPSGSPSHSTASVGAVTGPPNLPFFPEIYVWDPCQSCWSVPRRETWSGFGRWSTALYSGERAGGTAWWNQLSPHWLQQPTRGAGELIDSRWIRLESSSTLFD